MLGTGGHSFPRETRESLGLDDLRVQTQSPGDRLCKSEWRRPVGCRHVNDARMSSLCNPPQRLGGVIQKNGCDLLIGHPGYGLIGPEPVADGARQVALVVVAACKRHLDAGDT